MTRACLGGGTLVDAHRRVPALAAERRFGTLVGCNHVRCRRCGEVVRQVPRVTVDGVDPATAFVAPDLRTAPGVVDAPDALGRLYVCRCAWHLAVGPRELAYEGRDPLDEALPWACGGHPELSLPAELDGVRVTGTSADAGVVRAALAGTPDAPADLPPSEHRGYWLDRLADLVPALLPVVLHEARAALDDDRGDVVRRAIDVLLHRRAVPADVDTGALRWRRLQGIADPFVPTEAVSAAWERAVAMQAHADGPASSAAALGRLLRAHGATARMLRNLP